MSYETEGRKIQKRRTIRVSHRLNELKKRAKEKLYSEKELNLRFRKSLKWNSLLGGPKVVGHSAVFCCEEKIR